MWLMTTRGFVSAVEWQKNGDPRDGMIVVRARDRKHLEDVLAMGPRVPDVTETPTGADYRFRAWLTRAEFVALAANLALDVDYPNFKDAVEDRETGRRRGKKKPPLSPYARALHSAWSLFGRLQKGGPYGMSRPGTLYIDEYPEYPLR